MLILCRLGFIVEFYKIHILYIRSVIRAPTLYWCCRYCSIVSRYDTESMFLVLVVPFSLLLLYMHFLIDIFCIPIVGAKPFWLEKASSNVYKTDKTSPLWLISKQCILPPELSIFAVCMCAFGFIIPWSCCWQDSFIVTIRRIT